MRIKRIEVTDLFDFYCYEIRTIAHDSVTIVHAPNGYGKTTVFKMVTYMLNLDIYSLYSIPFSKFVLELSDSTIISAEKDEVFGDQQNRITNHFITLKIIRANGKEYKLNLPIDAHALMIIKEDGIDELARRLEMRRRRVPPNFRINEDTTNFINNYEKFGKQFESITDSIKINFIDSNRLFLNNEKRNRNARGNRRGSSVKSVVYQYDSEDEFEDGTSRVYMNESIITDAEDILRKIQNARQEYSLESEKKDRDFPDRLVEYVNSKREDLFNDEMIEAQLDALEQKRVELEKAGLVLSGKKTLAPSKSIDDTMRKFYTLYIKDTLEKLSLYDEIKAKIELFVDIINTKTSFSNKKMRIDRESGVVFEPIESKTGKCRSIPLDKLSSGEKHDFIMFYELIFNANNDTVFLIDEPEISLHVAWQTQFISVLEKICKLTRTQAIVATHSPDIVNGHDDLLVSLGLEDDNDN